MNTRLISIVIPVLNEEDSIQELFYALHETASLLKDIEFEVVFINDGSTDSSLSVLLDLKGHSGKLQIIDFSRNFGKEAAITAGLRVAKGDAVVIMDADLQHPPEAISAMIAAWHDGADIVLAKRRQRTAESSVRRFLSSLFYKVHNTFSQTKIPEGVSDFRLISRQVVDAVNELNESSRFMKGILAWVGFRSVSIPYDQIDRQSGGTRFTLSRLLRYSLDGLLSFSDVPMRLWIYLGVSIALSTFVYLIIVLIKTMFYGADTPGYASLIIAVGLIGSFNLIGIGLLGEYLSRTFLETKRRPLYIIKSHFDSK